MPNHRKSEASPEVWEHFYDAGKMEWRSNGLGDPTRCWLGPQNSNSKSLIEVGCGTGDDSREIDSLGYSYLGIDISKSAISVAQRENPDLKHLRRDFFDWNPKQPFDIAYDKGVYHGLGGHDRRKEFVEKLASILKPNGMWISVCGAADNRNPDYTHGAIYLTDFVSVAEIFFEIREVRKHQYGLVDEERDFDAWYVLATRR